MIAGLPMWATGLLAGLLGVAVVGGIMLLADRRQDDDLDEFRVDPEAGDGEEENDAGTLPDEVAIEPPTLRGSRFGILGEVYKTWRYLNKTEKLAGKGYVKWYCIDDTMPNPRFIKPEDEGEGVPRYDFDDGTYFFPREGAKPAANTGMWTFIHQKNDPEPLNIHDHRETVMTAEQVKEWLTQAVTAERPSSGMFDFLGDLDAQDALPIAIGLAVVFAVLTNQGVV